MKRRNNEIINFMLPNFIDKFSIQHLFEGETIKNSLLDIQKKKFYLEKH